MAAEGIVFDIQKFCVHDGPGIRTAVFLKGCMMNCIWCHNPESIRRNPELAFESQKCISCQACAAACKQGVHHFDAAGNHEVNFEKCAACQACIHVCPTRCLKIFGEKMNAHAVIKEVLKDQKYFKSSGGGVTFTGGEPTVQYDFLLEMMKVAKENNLHVCLETNGIIFSEKLSHLMSYTDLFLIDYKATGEIHKILTGVEESFVRQTIDSIHKAGGKMILRCPIVEGLNDSEEHFAQIRKFKSQYSSILNVEIMAYHASGLHKWESLGIDYSLKKMASATPEMKKYWEAKIAE
ncbi:glycyl-radical enzyme activating protein [Scatolibacter rhodanostii]|uniref:glycyl-radical enzyme activating protein n=1 Tax=Scatolibacter rhodanostii TaxID=2014781 RepID=UPI000C08D33B|nr:glycyl-radical enzyme activating protein [Scatolibacter rhodanostii]